MCDLYQLPPAPPPPNPPPPPLKPPPPKPPPPIIPPPHPPNPPTPGTLDQREAPPNPEMSANRNAMMETPIAATTIPPNSQTRRPARPPVTIAPAGRPRSARRMLEPNITAMMKKGNNPDTWRERALFHVRSGGGRGSPSMTRAI